MEEDVVDVESKALSTTGGQLWNAARVLLQHLLVHEQDRCKGCIVELGSGVGWLGLSLAAKNKQVSVIMTDQDDEEQLALLRSNVARNNNASVQVLPCDFMKHEQVVHLAGMQPAMVVASDVVYTRELALAFPRAVKIFFVSSKSAPVVLYAHTFGRYEFVDDLMRQEFHANGLVVEEFEENSLSWTALAPPASPDDWMQSMELFPPLRTAVLQISLFV